MAEELNDEDDREYEVVVNHEEQYSIWLAERELPLGWTKAGYCGRKKECLDHIETVWIDMRPLSLRKHMEQNPDDRSDTSPANPQASSEKPS